LLYFLVLYDFFYFVVFNGTYILKTLHKVLLVLQGIVVKTPHARPTQRVHFLLSLFYYNEMYK